MKKATVKVWEIPGQGFKVQSYTNTTQLCCGMILTTEQFNSLCGNPRVNAICTGLEPVKENENDLLSEPDEVFSISAVTTDTKEPARVNGANFEAKENSTQFEQARQFDILAADLCIAQSLISDGVLATATSPDPGENGLGTVGIKGRIERSNAIKTMREQTAKFLGLSPDTITSVAARAAALPVINAFCNHYARQLREDCTAATSPDNQPF